ncbi:PRD domain-containing protein, partial [[Ruminococcus] torques]|nr:PRD domain-containing protein [[Ruminococcus] torques]
ALVPFAGKHELRIIQGHGGTLVEGTESCLRKALAELLLYILDNNINANTGSNPAAAGMFESDTLMTILDIFTEEDLNFV